MGFLVGLLYFLLVVVSLFLCFVILIQDSKSGGLSTAFGGSGDTVLGASAQKQISKFTVYVSVVFFVLCVTIGILSKQISGTSLVDEEAPPATAGVEGLDAPTPAGLSGGTGATPDPTNPGVTTPSTSGTGSSESPGEVPSPPKTDNEKPEDNPDGNGG